jgi:hypothetical protein
MNFYIFISIFFLFTLGANKNVWSSNTIVYKGDTLYTFEKLLEARQDSDSLLSTLLGTFQFRQKTHYACDYNAEWLIENDMLYLTKMEIIDNHQVAYQLDLSSTFKGECTNKRIYAKWINSYVHVHPRNSLMRLGKFQPIFLFEIFLCFENGNLIEQTFYDNSKSYRSVFHNNTDSLNAFIRSNINWSYIPDLKENIYTVYIGFQSCEIAKPDSVRIEDGCEIDILNDEALRVMELLPEWDIYYYRGQFKRTSYICPLIFSEEHRKLYQHLKRQ